jgi:type I restriction enzyme R subunit
LEQATNDAIGLFGNSDAHGVVLLKTFEEYYYEGYDDDKGNHQPAYKEMVETLRKDYPLPVGTDAMSEEAKKDFIRKYSYIMKLYNILSTFDAFEGKELLGEQERQHYASAYIELYYEFKNMKKGEAENVNDDIAFEMELIKQDEISIDRILYLIQEYAKEHMSDMEVIAKIRNAVNASPDLRNKKDLIEQFLKGVTAGSDVGDAWAEYIKQQKDEELQKIIEEEHLKTIETRNFMEMAFRNGFVSISGTAFAQMLPAVSRFSKDSKREEMRQRVYEKLCAYLEKYKDLSNPSDEDEESFAWEMPEVEIKEKKEITTEMTPMIGENGGMKALAMYQPWASFLACGISKVENRNWVTEERGTFLIAANNTKLEWDSLDPQVKGIYKNLEKQGILPAYEDLPTNAIIGYADLTGIVERSNLPGTNKKYSHHFVIKNPHVFNKAILNHTTGRRFYEVKEITPENMPAAHQLNI